MTQTGTQSWRVGQDEPVSPGGGRGGWATFGFVFLKRMGLSLSAGLARILRFDGGIGRGLVRSSTFRLSSILGARASRPQAYAKIIRIAGETPAFPGKSEKLRAGRPRSQELS
jgi:hypothetical protein